MVPRGQFLIIDAASKKRPLPGDLLVCPFPLSLLIRLAATKTQPNLSTGPCPGSSKRIRACRLLASQNRLKVESQRHLVIVELLRDTDARDSLFPSAGWGFTLTISLLD